MVKVIEEPAIQARCPQFFLYGVDLWHFSLAGRAGFPSGASRLFVDRWPAPRPPDRCDAENRFGLYALNFESRALIHPKRF